MQLSQVQRLIIEPTSFCNAKCPHCPRFDDLGRLHPNLTLSHLDFDSIVNLQVDQLTSLVEVELCGDKGDPCMHPEIEKIIEYFSNINPAPIITMHTNGSIRNAAWWNTLGKKYPRLQVIFSIDGLEDTNHLYRVGLDFDTIMKNTAAFIQGGGYAIWKMLAFDHNEHQISQIQQLSQTQNFAEFRCFNGHLNRFQNLAQWPVNVDGVFSHYLKPAKQNYEITIKHSIIPVKRRRLYQLETKICPWQKRGILYISHQNYVLPCCMMHFETQLEYPGKYKFLEMVEEIKYNDLSIYKLEDVLNHKFFNNNLEDSLRNSDYHSTCTASCKNEIAISLEKIKL